MAIRISKHQLYIGAASVAMLAFMATAAQAQYHTLKSQEPQVELNLDRLSSGEAGPAARPLWEPKADTPPNQMPAGTPPVKLRQPLKMPENMAILPAPSVAGVPIAAEQPAAKTAAETPLVATDEAQTAGASVNQATEPSHVLKPVFAAPVIPPAAAPDVAAMPTPAAANTEAEIKASAPAAAEPLDIAEVSAAAAAPEVMPQTAPVPAPAPQAELKPAKLMDPILEPEGRAKAARKSDKKISSKQALEKPALLPARKPETATATETPKAAENASEKVSEKTTAAVPAPKPAAKLADKTIMSYPPAQPQKETPVTRYERPVLPQGLGGNYDAPAPNTAAPAAPAAPHGMPPQPANDIKLDGVVIPADIQEDPTEAALVDTTKQQTQATPAAAVANTDEVGADMPATVMTAADLDAAAEAAPAEPAPQATAKATETAAPARRPSLVVTQDPAPAQRKDTVPARMAAPAADDITVPTMADLTLEFDGVSSDLNEGTQQKLVNLLPILKEDEGRRLAVHAYASGEDGSKSSARRISLSRALAVRAFLMDNGVKPTRVDVRALGLETDRKPLERVDLVFAR